MKKISLKRSLTNK